MICTCVPYEWNWSQDVEKYALDLVLSSFTHTNTVQAIAVASTGARFSHQSPYDWVYRSSHGETTDVSRYISPIWSLPLHLQSQHSSICDLEGHIAHIWRGGAHVSTLHIQIHTGPPDGRVPGGAEEARLSVSGVRSSGVMSYSVPYDRTK